MNKNCKPSHKLRSFQHVEKLALAGIDLADWYDVAMADIASVCELEEWNTTEFTSKLAILSPRVSVRRNIRSAYVYCGQNKALLLNTLPNVKRSLQVYNQTGIVGGYKVPYFLRSLLGDNTSICLDSWMSKALLAMDEPSITYFRRQATFDSACGLVNRIADKLGLSPSACQAAIWCGTFRYHGQEPSYYPIIEEYDNWVLQNREFPLSGVISSYDEYRLDSDELSFDTEFLESQTQEAF